MFSDPSHYLLLFEGHHKNLNSASFRGQKNIPTDTSIRIGTRIKNAGALNPSHGFDLCSSFPITIFHVDTRIPWVLIVKFPSFCTCLSKSCVTQLLSWSQEPKATTLICDSWTSCDCCLWWRNPFHLCLHFKGKILKITFSPACSCPVFSSVAWSLAKYTPNHHWTQICLWHREMQSLSGLVGSYH